MKKSLIALLLTLALVVTMSVFAVSAEEPDYTLTVTDGVATAACPCDEHKGATATFTACTAMPTAAGHYYLSDNVSVSGQTAFPANAAVVLHLNGKTYQRTGQGAAIASHAGATITILDNPENAGGFMDRNSTDAANTWGGYGGIIQLANKNTTLNIYGGTYELTETLKDVNGAVIGVSQATNVVNIYGGNFTGTVSANGLGGAFAVSAGTLNIYGGTITGSAKQGGSIYATGADSLINIEGGTISGGSAADRGGNIAIVNSANATVSGGTISGGTVTGGVYSGGNIYVENGCLLTVNDGATITGGSITTAGSYGGGNIGIRGTGQMIMNGGTISNGNHAGKGGNIFKENGGKVTLNGGIITAGIATNGANVYAIASAEANRPTVEVNGATISAGNASTGTCGGVYISGYATLTMTDGTITGGTSKYGGGNIRTNGANCVVNVSGGTISDGTVTSGDGGNLFSNTASTINITGGTFSGGTATGAGANVCLTNAGANSVLKNATISGGTSSKTNGSSGATFYLSSANFAEISGMTFIGGKATGSGANGGGVLITTGSYTIKNSTFTGGQAYGYGGALLLTGAGTTTLEGCTVSGGCARYGSNICVNAGTLNLVDTDIEKNGNQSTAIYGGGVYVGTATVNMDKDSTISDCMVMHGGSVALGYSTSVFNLNGGTISGGKAVRNSTTLPFGGNVAVLLGTFNMNSGTITGGKLTNSVAGGFGGNVYVGGGTFNLVDGTISNGTASTKEGALGGNIYIATYETSATVDNVTTYTVHPGSFVMTKGTVSGGTAQANGGNIYVAGVAANTDHATAAAGATLDINGGELIGGTAVTGGSIYIDALAGSVTINDATISDGKATGAALGVGGGNIWNALGTTTITDCTISGGVAEGSQGGNIYNKATGLTVTGCRIVDGVAGKRVETETTDAETGEPVITVSYPNTHGRGGNFGQTAGSATFTNCVIKDGTSYSNGSGGGNVYLGETIGETKFDGCTITGGYGNNQSGNFQHHARGTAIITGDSYIAGGKVGGNWGANIGVTNGGAILKIDGETEINATGTSGTAAGNGINIHVSQPNASLHLLGNSRVVLGSVASTCSIVRETYARSGNATDGYTYTAGSGKVYLGGNAFMDKYVEMRVWTSTQNVPAGAIVVNEGFTGDALLITRVGGSNYSSADNGTVGLSGKAVNFGAEAPAYLAAGTGYANTGTVKVHSQGRSGYVVSYSDKFTIAPYTAFIPLNNGLDASNISSHVEAGLANFDTLPAGTGYVKLYTNTALALNENLDGMPIDLNNQVITIDTNGYTLAPIDYRTDGGVVSKTKLTVTGDETKVQLLVKNPVTNFQYLNVKGEDGTWTSNRIRVELTKVSIKTTKDGIYYTTKVNTNDNAKAVLEDFGTAVTVAEGTVIGSDFMEVAEEQGILYTCMPYDKEATGSQEARSALITGILSSEEGADNDARCNIEIKATSYVTAVIEGLGDVVIMADEASELSMKEIMIKLDEKVEKLDVVDDAATIATAVGFYTKWADPFAAWDCLPNLKKAAEAAA